MPKIIVTPGEKISDKPEKGTGIYVRDGKTYSKYVGVLYKGETVQVVPLNGKYSPKERDLIIGLIISEDLFGYVVDVRSYHYSYIPKKNIEIELKPGDLILCQVVNVNEIKDLTVDVQAKLEGGVLLEVSAKKVPRVIGKHRSMISLLENLSKSRILVGANGYVFCRGGNPNMVKTALELISKYSHVDNLTEKIGAYLRKSGE